MPPESRDHELQNHKKEFLASVSHEMRTPLSVIMGYVQILKEETLGPLTAEQKKSLDTIYGRAEDLLRVMTHLLAARELQEGKKNIKLEALDLRAFLAERLARPIREKTRKGMTLEQRLGAEEIWVKADAQKLGEVIDNLVLNAVKFGPEKSAVRVALSSDGREARVSVQDSGPGLSDEEKRRLFEPFSATERGLAREHGGLGLSLFLCREILEQHGGSIFAGRPEGAASGCLAQFALPLSAKPAAKGSVGTAAPRVLVVEDDMDFLQLMVIFLSRLGDNIEVTAAETGGAALAEIAKRAPDLIILDLMLPGMDGISILERLKKDRKTAGVPVLIVSGYEAGAQKAGRAGAEDVLIKPFEEAVFAAKISALLSKNGAAKGR
ncbi:MAG TPA: response regulator [Elusimicrobiota bacterium]|nr:response regulator [Elusimicrobiota bacterium]